MKMKEDFHEYLRAYTDILTKNCYATKWYNYSNIKRLVKDEKIEVVPGDKTLIS